MLPQDFCSELMEWGKKNIGDDLLSGIKNKGREGSPHVTLATGIIDEEPGKALEILSSVAPFEIELGDVSTFDKRDKGYDVVKLEVASPVLHSLNSDILQSLEVQDPIKPYSPHATIAYVRPGACDKIVGNDSFSGKKLPIDSVVYSNRDVGGKIIHLKRPALKESLDYGVTAKQINFSLEEIKDYIAEQNIPIKTLSAYDICRVIIQISNKCL